MSKIAERLARLLALADLEDGADDARQNEARNAAMELLRTVKKHKVRIKFQIPSEPVTEKPPPSPEPFFRHPPRTQPAGTYSNDFFPGRGTSFDDILRDFTRAVAGEGSVNVTPGGRAGGHVADHPGAKYPRRHRSPFTVVCWRCKKKINAGDMCVIGGPGKAPCHESCDP